jgi:ABC-type bacteriocin/lantibiotic exporter with double-glycine peptidase domain
MVGSVILAVVLQVGLASAVDGASNPSSVVADDPQAPSPYWLDDVRNCGPRCLAYLDQKFGHRRTFREICALCPPLREGVPIADLARAADALGWGATPFEGSFGDLARLRHPAILHLKAAKQRDPNDALTQNHYVVLLKYDAGTRQYLLYDPPNDVHWVSRGYLKPRFSGLGLLVASRLKKSAQAGRPPSAPRGPAPPR